MSARALSRLALSGVLVSSVASAQSVSPRVTVETTPPGAKVYVDGKDKGIACQSGPSCKPRMSRGAHRLIIELDGYRPMEEKIDVSGPQRFAFTLQAAPARLDIKTLATNPAGHGGEVYVDGKLAGSVPTELEVSAGKHMLEVRRLGYQPYTEAIEVKGGETHPVFVALNAESKGAPTTGALMITSELNGSEVLVDEQPRGPAPVLIEGLPPGDHVVEIRPRAPGYQAWRRNVRVTPGQQAAAYATFTANPPPPPMPMPPPGEPVLPVAFVPRSADTTYVVTLPSGQSCATPCTLQLPPGGQVLSVSGPGSNNFREPVNIPDVPAQVTVQHFTTGRLVGGIIMTVLAIPIAAIGTVYLADPLSLPRALLPDTYDQGYIIGGVMVGAGAALAVGGIISLATIKTNHAEVHALGPIRPQLASRVRLLGAGVAPLADRSGAVASATLAY